MPSKQILYKEISDIFGTPENDFFMSVRSELVEVKQRIGKMCLMFINKEGPFEVNIDNAMALFGKNARLLKQILDDPQIGDVIPATDGRTVEVVDRDEDRVYIQIPKDSCNILPVNLIAFRQIIGSALDIKIN